MINKVILVGNLGKDPEVRHFEGNSSVASFSVATSESYMDKTTNERKTQTEWHNVVMWNGLAGVAEKYLKRGSQVYIEGKLTTRKWQDKDGNDRYSTEVVARTMKMLGSKEGGSSYSPPASDKSAQVAKEASPASQPTATSAPATAEKIADSPDDDLPF
ncbi:MAG: single-strand DNA-binding protein [Granulosicoccus sp.]|jgi:single-strand DNA-binding protein